MSTQKRRSYYYSRVKVPADLRPVLQKTELVRSLRTSRYREAVVKGSEWEGRVARLFGKIRKGLLLMTPQDISKLVDTYIRRELEDNEQAIAESEDMSWAEWEGIAGHMHDELETASCALMYNELGKVADVANSLLAEHSINIDEQSPPYKRLCRELLKAKLKVSQTSHNRWYGDYSGEEPEPSLHVSQVPQDEPIPTAPLSKVIGEFNKAKELEGSWAYRTGVMFKSGLQLFLDIMDDRPMGEVTKEDIRRFHETLQKLPTSMSQRFPKLSVQEVIKLDAEPKLSASSVDKYLRYVKSLFIWAKENDYIEKNPTETLRLKKPKSNAHDDRAVFTDEELRLIFSGDYAKHRVTRPDRWWIPVILLHTGARLEEIAQLSVDDIKQVDGVWCFDIRDAGEDQNLKNASSIRTVPIHSRLIDLGFLDYHRQVKRQGHGRLWPQLQKTANGYGSAISKWFNPRLRRLGIKDDKKVLYSTRHTVITHLKYADAQDHTIAELVGHKVEGITMGRYGKKLDVKRLRAVIELLDFRFIEVA